MKITKPDYAELKTAIENYLKPENSIGKQAIEKAYADCSRTRMLWDVMAASGFLLREGNRLYKYLNDSNIEAAANKIWDGL